MKKLALTAGAVLALSVLTAPAAFAQDDTSACDVAKDSVAKLEKKLDDAAAEERVKEKDALDEAKRVFRAAQAEVDRLQAIIDDPNADEGRKDDARRLLPAAKDDRDTAKAKRDDAQAKLDNDSNKVAGLRAQVELAVQERDDACGGVTTTPTTPADPADVDCDEVGASEAQRILDADRNDPHNLDQDKDGIACEIDEILDPPADDNDSNVTVEVVTPTGGVATGGGPA